MISPDARRALEDVLADSVDFQVPMSRHTSLRVGGPAEALATPGSREELAALLSSCAAHRLPYALLGAGFNTLVGDRGVAGVVIKLSRLRALALREDGRVLAEAGVTHASLTRFCVERGRSGLEFGAGIPGVMGGWVTMNAGVGSREGTREVKDVVCAIEVMGPAEGDAVPQARWIERRDLDFVYRGLSGLAPGTVVVSAAFDTTAADPEVVKAEVDRLLASRAESQPLNVPSCGSVFRNPKGDFAGRLIEAAGLKGLREGGARISPVHANFIANTGGATAADVRRLMRRAQEAVWQQTGIRLEPEVHMLGCFEPEESD